MPRPDRETPEQFLARCADRDDLVGLLVKAARSIDDLAGECAGLVRPSGADGLGELLGNLGRIQANAGAVLDVLRLSPLSLAAELRGELDPVDAATRAELLAEMRELAEDLGDHRNPDPEATAAQAIGVLVRIAREAGAGEVADAFEPLMRSLAGGTP